MPTIPDDFLVDTLYFPRIRSGSDVPTARPGVEKPGDFYYRVDGSGACIGAYVYEGSVSGYVLLGSGAGFANPATADLDMNAFEIVNANSIALRPVAGPKKSVLGFDTFPPSSTGGDAHILVRANGLESGSDEAFSAIELDQPDAHDRNSLFAITDGRAPAVQSTFVVARKIGSELSDIRPMAIFASAAPQTDNIVFTFENGDTTGSGYGTLSVVPILPGPGVAGLIVRVGSYGHPIDVNITPAGDILVPRDVTVERRFFVGTEAAFFDDTKMRGQYPFVADSGNPAIDALRDVFVAFGLMAAA